MIETLYPDVTTFTLDTPLWNIRTNNFYQKLGYEVEKKEPYDRAKLQRLQGDKRECILGRIELYRCNEEKKQEHCGKCSEFPCDKLKKGSSSENPERIDNLRNVL